MEAHPTGAGRRIRNRTLLILGIVLGALTIAVLACAGDAVNMAIQGQPEYICPSSTPIPTNVMPPPSPPYYPPGFLANLDYWWIDPMRSFVDVQYMAQNVGWIQVSYQGVDAFGNFWPGSGGPIYVNLAGNGPAISGSYPIWLPSNLSSVQIFASAGGYWYPLSVAIFSSPFSGGWTPPPCCLAPPIYPTPRPTYTPYPTPTLYSIPPYNNGDYFLNDPVYSFQPPIQIRARVLSPIDLKGQYVGSTLMTAATWTTEITNVGSVEYDYLGAGYMYISQVNDLGNLINGIWSPSHGAADFLGITESAYGPQAIMPGQTIIVKVAAYIPSGLSVSTVSLNLDPFHQGDPGWATFTPGSGRIATWINKLNTVCEGQIAYP